MSKPLLLQIEDSSDYCLIFTKIFSPHFEIILCPDFKSVKELPAEVISKLNLIICDGNLPDGNGEDILSFLKNKTSAPMVGNSSLVESNNLMNPYTRMTFLKSRLLPEKQVLIQQCLNLVR